MKVGKSVRKCIDEWQAGDMESAMLHACNAVDGTAKKVYLGLGNKDRFTRLIRENYAIFGPMGAPGINLEETRFPVTVKGPTAPGGQPDIADIIYSIHRCTHGHGDELPEGFELIPDVSGSPERTRMRIEKGKIQLSDRVLFGLLSLAVFSDANIDQATPDGYHLTFGGANVMLINKWWGRAEDFLAMTKGESLPSVKLDFGNWMT